MCVNWTDITRAVWVHLNDFMLHSSLLYVTDELLCSIQYDVEFRLL